MLILPGKNKIIQILIEIYPHTRACDSGSYSKYRLNPPPKALMKGRHWRWCLNFRYTSLAHLALLLPVVILQTVSCLRGVHFMFLEPLDREIIERYIPFNYFIIFWYTYIHTHTHTRTWRQVLSLHTRETHRHMPWVLVPHHRRDLHILCNSFVYYLFSAFQKI